MEWVIAGNPNKGQFSIEGDQYPLAWEAFNSMGSALDRALETRQILMEQYGLDQPEAEAVVGKFLQSGRRISASDEPKWAFMYYKSAIEVIPWSHNVRYRDIAKRLLNKFNTDLGDSGWKDDEGDWSGGDIFEEDDGLRVHFKHLAAPDVQEDALKAIKAWWKEKPRENSEIEWSMADPSDEEESASE